MQIKERKITIPELGLFAITRAALGFGIGLLVSRVMSRDERKAAGIALTVVGALTTIPLVLNFARERRGAEEQGPRMAA